MVEIPTNERNKYELDKKLGVFRLDRVLHSAVHYPGDYGFLPRTLGDDGLRVIHDEDGGCVGRHGS